MGTLIQQVWITSFFSIFDLIISKTSKINNFWLLVATTHSNGNASTSSTTNFHVETSSENTDDSSWFSSFSDPTQESTETLLTTDLTTDEFYFTSSEDVLDENSERSSMVTVSHWLNFNRFSNELPLHIDRSRPNNSELSSFLILKIFVQV